MNELTYAAYGKQGVRVLSWTNDDAMNVARDLSIDLEVEGDFEGSFLHGDNRNILPSDTFRRHLLAECSTNPTFDLETLLLQCAHRVLTANPATAKVAVKGIERSWRSVGEHSFIQEPLHLVSTVTVTSGDVSCVVESGIEGLNLFNSTGNAFTGFLRDALTEQREAIDRPMLGVLNGYWTYGNFKPSEGRFGKLKNELLAGLIDRKTNSVQEFLAAAARHLLDVFDVLDAVRLDFAATSMDEIDLNLTRLKGMSTFEVGNGSCGITKVELTRSR